MTSAHKWILTAFACALAIYLGLNTPSEPATSAAATGAYQSRDFSHGAAGTLNISVYTFRDFDGDGEFSIGDHPLAGIAVQMTRPDGKQITRRSNVNGFANFSMSLGNDSANIYLPARGYHFHTLAPPDWRTTNENGEQTLEAKALEGSYAGLVFTPPPAWVGLKPTSAPAGLKETVVKNGVIVENFDSITEHDLAKIPSGYRGLTWDYLVVANSHLYQAPGMANNCTSGKYLSYNSSGHPVTISSPKGSYFDFVGGHFGVAWPQAEGETLEIKGWRDGEIRFEEAIKLSYLKARWLQADWRQIDKLELKSEHYWQFTLDDLYLRLPEDGLSEDRQP